MASPSPSVVELASIFENLVINNRCEFAAFALLVAEYVAHFMREVDLFWGSKITGASILFLSNRYLSLLSMITQTVTSLPMSPQSCATLTNAVAAFSVLQYFPWAAFSCLRTYALCEHRRWTVATVVFLLYSVPIGMNFSRYRWLDSTTVPVFSCLPQVDIPEELGKQVLLALNVLHLLFTMLSIDYESLVPVSYVTIFTEPITAILISRFILDLQEVNRGLVRLQSGTSEMTTAFQSQSSVNFAKFIGPLGSSLVSAHSNTETDSAGDEIAEKATDTCMEIETVARV
ncbi:hypothetical protein C8T65DRAFT_810010 [Cerioporus squamosus]|nr:hypothetical protein C8T65DRAFT_810010 [Cerioporus squamosus]